MERRNADYDRRTERCTSCGWSAAEKHRRDSSRTPKEKYRGRVGAEELPLSCCMCEPMETGEFLGDDTDADCTLCGRPCRWIVG